MTNDVTVKITIKALRDINPVQLEALQTQVLEEGRWDTAREIVIWVDNETIMCNIYAAPADVSVTPFVIGIETDGYVHS